MSDPPLSAGGVDAATAPPTAYRHVWYPASVSYRRADGRTATVHMAKVFMTDTGVQVYVQGRDDLRQAQVQLVYSADVNYGKTPRPPADYASTRAGYTIATSGGPLVVQPGGGCGTCGYKTLNGFTPPWARTVVGWE